MIYQYHDIILHYEILGYGKPIVVLHGLGCDLEMMKSCLEPIFTNNVTYKRIYIDLPGMGKSKASHEYASSDKILNVLMSFINNTLDEPYLLIGESYGGYLARGILSRNAEKIDGVMFLCPVIIPDKDIRRLPREIIKFPDTSFLEKLSQAERNNFSEYAVIADEKTFTRYCNEILPGIETADTGFIDKLEQNYSFSFDVDDKIRNLHFKNAALFICGKQDDCVGYDDAWELINDYPRATFSVLDMAGHNLQIEQVDLFDSLVKNWLSRTNIDPTKAENKFRCEKSRKESL